MNRLKQLLGIDLRTLAVFRIALGAMLIVDLVTRAADLRAHYTDFGILPRDFWLSPQAGTLTGWEFSFHLASGTAWFQVLLFIIAGLFAFMLVVGYCSRLASVMSWLLLLSLHHRNLYVLQGSDMLLLLMLLWAMFLPLGARWSFDAALTKDSSTAQNPYISVMGAGLLLQVVSVYFFTALLKDSPDWWPDGIAVFYVTHYAHYLSSTGESLGLLIEQYPSISYVLSYSIWFLEFLTPFLLFFSVFNTTFRFITLLMLTFMHLGFWIFMEIGLFPLVSLTSLLIFIPGTAWLWIEGRIRTVERTGVHLYYDNNCDFCLKVCYLLRTFLLLGDTPISAATNQPRIQAVLEENNSWVVIDHDGSMYSKWDAMILLFRRSFLFHPLSPALALRPLRQLGNRLYDWVATHRPMLSRWSTRWLPWRRAHIEEPLLVSLLGIVFIVLLLVSNVESLQKWPVRHTELVEPLRRTIRFLQWWSMFAPSPIGQSMWLVVKGELKDGTEVDVLRGSEDGINWDRPDNIADWHPNYRWRKYFHFIASEGYEWYRWHWGLYLCRRWNENASSESRLTKHTIYWMIETLHPGWEGKRSISKHEGQTITCAEDPS